jgi:hypothetical protein
VPQWFELRTVPGFYPALVRPILRTRPAPLGVKSSPKPLQPSRPALTSAQPTASRSGLEPRRPKGAGRTEAAKHVVP